MVVLSHLQSGSMDGGCKRRLIILLADAQVLAPQGAVSVVGLQPGFELRSRRGPHATKTEERFSLNVYMNRKTWKAEQEKFSLMVVAL